MKSTKNSRLGWPPLLLATAIWVVVLAGGAEISSPALTVSPSSTPPSDQQNTPVFNLGPQQPTTNPKPEAPSTDKRQSVGPSDDEYLIGFGIADITGPSADINLMGYAKPNQVAGGIHLRQFSRAVIVEDRNSNRILYLSIDNGMVSQLLSAQVLARLNQLFGSNMFNETNVMMSATHTHSCPGGFFQYMLYNIPSAGYVSQSLGALVDGMVRSVQRALDELQPGRIYLVSGELADASINRSPTSYEQNPAEERAKYKQNTDNTMHLLRFVDLQNRPLGVVNWFPVHGTSMNNTNLLISSDNKGYASLLLEHDFNPPATLPGRGKFVAIFAQANEGDVSPNTSGPRCVDTGLPCDPATSTCGQPPRNEKCIASGPGRDMFESTRIIAHKQYQKARELLLQTAGQIPVRGPVRFAQEFIDITHQQVPAYESPLAWAAKKRRRRNHQQLDGEEGELPGVGGVASIDEPPAAYNTCQAALGYSFAAGTTDGPGAFDFTQGDSPVNRYWMMMRDLLRRPDLQAIQCQQPKPILLYTGGMDFPYMWHPKVIPTQIITLGQLAIVGLPGEFTTMAGRRVRQAVAESLGGDVFESADAHAPQVVLSGLSNIYSSYITTFEEYQHQRYEGASTLYGPHTLQAYVNQFRRLAKSLAENRPLTNGSSLKPPDLRESLFGLRPGVIYDGAPSGKAFGEPLQDVDTKRPPFNCQEVVNVSFVTANPRNDLKHELSYLYVDRFDTKSNSWQPIASDASWETKFIWERTNTLMGESKATVEWTIPHDCQSGVHRIRHFGASKNFLQRVSQFWGKSSNFLVLGRDGGATLSQLEQALKMAQQVDANEQQDDILQRDLSGQDASTNDRRQPTNIVAQAVGILTNWFNG